MYVGESRKRRADLRVLHIPLVGERGTCDQPASVVLAKLKHDVGRELVSGVLLVPEDWQRENIKCCVPYLMSEDIEELADHRVSSRDSHRRIHRGQRLHDLLQVLVADTDRGAIVPGVRHAIAWANLQLQLDRQQQGAEDLLQPLKRPPLFERIIDHLMRRVLWWIVFGLDAIWRRLGCCRVGGVELQKSRNA